MRPTRSSLKGETRRSPGFGACRFLNDSAAPLGMSQKRSDGNIPKPGNARQCGDTVDPVCGNVVPHDPAPNGCRT